MHWIRQIMRRIGRVFRRQAAERSMSEEMRFHLEMEERELRGAGHSPEEARRLARVRFGGVERYKEESRDVRGRLLDDVRRDARQSLRGFRRRPGFAAAVIATMAVGIGATTAVWSVVDGALLRPLPYPQSDRLARIDVSWDGQPDGALSPAEFLDFWREGGEAFTALGAYARGTVTLAGVEGEPAQRVDAGFLSADLFPALGVRPLLGRPFTAEEEQSGQSVVLLAEGLWRRRFGGDPAIVGSTVPLNGAPVTVLGVMPGSFRLPENMLEGSRPGVFAPLGIDPDTTYERGSHFLQSAGRLRPGVSVAAAAEQVELVAARFAADFPEEYRDADGFRFTAEPLKSAMVGDAEAPLVVAFGAVVLVLLVGAANVAALLLARGEARQGEMALRATLGARRPRLVRQLLVETLLLALMGGVLGVALAWLGVGALVAMSPPGIPRLDEIGLDGRVLAFAGSLSVGCGLLFGLLPALRVAPRSAAGVLREAGIRSVGVGARRLRQALVVGEIALALALLTGAGLLARSLSELLAVDTGLDINDRVIATQLAIPSSRYATPDEVRTYLARATEQVAALPGVEAAGAIRNLPLSSGIGDLGVSIPGKELPGDGNLAVDWQAATPGYDRAVGLELVAGRWIEAADRSDAPGAVVINRTFAETWWPEGDALGATVRLSARTSPEEARVVGIVEDVRHEGPSTAPRLQIYIPHRQFMFWYGGGPARSMTLTVRSASGLAVVPAVRRALADLDGEIGLGSFITLEQAFTDVLARPRLLAGLLAAFALAALLLAAIGIYGVMAYSVGQRRREFGIRTALGARARSIAGAVVLEGLALAAIGVGLGVLGAAALAQTLRTLLYGVSATDPWVLTAGAAVLTMTALAASWLPARRALRADPARALRAE